MTGLLVAAAIMLLSIVVTSVRSRSVKALAMILGVHVMVSVTAFVLGGVVYRNADTKLFVAIALGPGAILAGARLLRMLVP